MPKKAQKKEKLNLTQEDVKAVKILSAELNKQEVNHVNGQMNTTVEKKVKMWDELTLEEKMERTRMQLKDHMRRIQRQLSNMEFVLHKIRRHKHTEDGRAVIEENLEQVYGRGESLLPGIDTVSNDQYF